MTIALTQARVLAYRSVAFGSITGSYTALGSAITNALRLLDFENTTDADVSISFDGTTDNIFLPAGSFRIYDLAANQLVLQNNTQIYIKSAGAPSSGAVYVTGIFARGN